MDNIYCCPFKGPVSFEEGNKDHVNTETDMAPADLYSQGHTEWEKTLDTTWAEALPFFPGEGYHGDGKFL